MQCLESLRWFRAESFAFFNGASSPVTESVGAALSYRRMGNQKRFKKKLENDRPKLLISSLSSQLATSRSKNKLKKKRGWPSSPANAPWAALRQRVKARAPATLPPKRLTKLLTAKLTSRPTDADPAHLGKTNKDFNNARKTAKTLVWRFAVTTNKDFNSANNKTLTTPRHVTDNILTTARRETGAASSNASALLPFYKAFYPCNIFLASSFATKSLSFL